MTAQLLAYPFLFFAIFFESFMLVTFLSKPARDARGRGEAKALPGVALIVPCYNEEATVTRTVESVFALDYPADKLELILVDDGSKDGTRAVMERYRAHPQVTLIFQENGGKHTALNAGIAATKAEIVGCLDADSFLEPDAVRRTVVCFERPQVAAAMNSIAIANPRGFFEHMQSAEYTMAMFYRHALCSINAMYVTPGPFSLYRRSLFDKVGPFRFGQQTEDMEMALRIQRAGYEIDNMPRTRVSTHAMDTLPKLVRQRMRWTSGFLRNVLFDYRDLFGRKYGALGVLILPLGLIAPFIVIGLTSITLYRLGMGAAHTYAVHQGLPFVWHFSLDWFYAPLTFLSLLSLVAGGMAIIMFLLGRRISGARSPLGLSMMSYFLLYGLLAPLWYFRATADVVTGTRRGWR